VGGRKEKLMMVKRGIIWAGGAVAARRRGSCAERDKEERKEGSLSRQSRFW
jgi:hypothetical protein